MCIMVIFFTPMYRYAYDLPMLKIMYSNFKWMSYWLLVLSNQNETRMHWHQSIDLHITYLCWEFKPISTFNKWFTGVFILANQNEVHVHGMLAYAQMVFPIVPNPRGTWF
jgi:hypothetical protein